MMSNKTAINMINKSGVFKLFGWVFGIGIITVGLINTFWGNDPGFGVFLLLLSMVYLPPVNAMTSGKFGLRISPVVKFALGIFIIVAALGVGELSDKVKLMMMDL